MPSHTEEMRCGIHEVLRIGELTFFANALIAFLLNIAVYIAIQVADALVYAMAGIVKALGSE